MANDTIIQVEGGEKHLPVSTDNIELDDGTSVFARLNNLSKALSLMEEGALWNYVITPSVAANNLTVALKTIAGADPSTDDAIVGRLGNARMIVTSALTFTLNAATGWFGAGVAAFATQKINYFVYLIQETGGAAGTKLGISRIPYAQTMGDFVNTNTNEKYIGGSWTNFNATDVVVNIGRFSAILSAGAGFTWSIPAPGVINKPIFYTETLTYVIQWTSGGTAPVLNNGTLVSEYQIINQDVFYVFNEVAGSTTTFGTGGLIWSLPFTSAAFTNGAFFGLGRVYDSSATTHYPAVSAISPSVNTVQLLTNASVSPVSATVPVTLATSDFLSGQGQYPIA